MAISDTISSIEDNIRADYEGLTNLGIDLTNINKNIENIKPCLDTVWNNLPKVSDTGTEVTLSPTLKGKLGIVEKGNSTQEGTPTPDSPSPIKNVTGNNNVVVRNSDNTQSQTLPLNLGNIELNKIGNYQDYIYKNNDKWYKKEVIGKIIFNGTETWNRVETGYSEIANRANITITDLPTHTANYIEFYSNYFYGSLNTMTLTTVKAGEMCQYRNTQTVYFGIPVTITSISELNSWLSAHNVDFYYIKATETDIEITDTNLISQLEEIDNMYSYNGTTIITSTFDSNNAQMVISASGLKGE